MEDPMRCFFFLCLFSLVCSRTVVSFTHPLFVSPFPSRVLKSPNRDVYDTRLWARRFNSRKNNSSSNAPKKETETETESEKKTSPNFGKPDESVKQVLASLGRKVSQGNRGDGRSSAITFTGVSGMNIHEQTEVFDSVADKERLQKVISRSGISSRRAAEDLIEEGRVRVNGRVVKQMGTRVNPRLDQIQVDGKRISMRPPSEIKWILLHKPKGYICTMADERDRKSVLDLVPFASRLRLLPVGRLDRDSSGLILLTNDNAWLHLLSHPSFGHLKTYKVKVKNGVPFGDVLEPLAKGMYLGSDKEKTSPVEIRVMLDEKSHKEPLGSMTVSLLEGRNRQIRRMFESIGHPVHSIKRIRFGPLDLDKVGVGSWRQLNPTEIYSLKRHVLQRAKEKGRLGEVRSRFSADRRRRPDGGAAEDFEGLEDEDEDEEGGDDLFDWKGGRADEGMEEREGGRGGREKRDAEQPQ
eukprot:Cvel_28078.t1-p1 / transcript=Cvel_28078.t1 / gene=Cvel_28078 / organism=Chromera_velia_CCMP2878 / gene_product=Ribosomal large subunit pseudouridine synthase B, putative / transcript_product=Ribosomal large subunit pseudouridine synthase B, putative / location=Cvel_scaffold3610:1518-5224(-) / protein_length=466 / sequence_SO=supercontig / SO=protein_coding / is_pseudo=false